ncbi:response regulator transcription factor [Pelagibacterium halotolerans]|uniref:DNA-binding response regulator n=1 Tax=Pelagibacterium halotolerans (strain DSM 22347 / JCM 15775 / CGMCC 1.7692 / B2) TaxID=1082931 RepID=G4R7P6_PELHB|nr:response regulator transcription factor [Pelagibacterium halotolerans]AEQ53306.1 DNA-binding response regulator [Pelagibacterium halotolerans B2]QJR17079.1 response regulator transcription factor [Pelagibacterium halotolerans]SEA63360.1 DNA-binding response regulator, OmpR family, contains REC and winged-helix (wHTH) domain [Pelagibacterium halotolerans]
MNKRRLLVVDDDTDLRAALVGQLEPYREFDITEAGTASGARETAKASHFDLMLLDVGLPDMDGREALKIMRADGFRAPVIMLTGQDSESDEIRGLESGANDYVTKPFRFSVLLARMRAALRQHDQSEDVVFTIGPYSFQPAAKTLENGDGSKIRLTDKETSILKFLYRQGAKTISRDVLLAEVWGYNNRVTTHTLETHIYRLRQKIERDPSNARLLVTEEGGYRLVP